MSGFFCQMLRTIPQALGPRACQILGVLQKCHSGHRRLHSNSFKTRSTCGQGVSVFMLHDN